MKRHSGFTLIESLIGIVLLAGVVYGIGAFFANYLRSRVMSRANAPIEQVEEAVRNEVLSFMIRYFRAGLVQFPPPAGNCTLALAQARISTGFPNGLNRNLPIGLNFRHLNAAELEALKVANNDAGVVRLNDALERCKSSSSQNIANNYFQLRAGVYFCLQFTGTGSLNLGTVQPLFGEFFYTNVNPIAVAKNSEVLCPALNGLWNVAVPPVPTMGQLFYRLYWSSPLPPAGRLHRSRSGLITGAS